jgi:hypothetical protein
METLSANRRVRNLLITAQFGKVFISYPRASALGILRFAFVLGNPSEVSDLILVFFAETFPVRMAQDFKRLTEVALERATRFRSPRRPCALELAGDMFTGSQVEPTRQQAPAARAASNACYASTPSLLGL